MVNCSARLTRIALGAHERNRNPRIERRPGSHARQVLRLFASTRSPTNALVEALTSLIAPLPDGAQRRLVPQPGFVEAPRLGHGCVDGAVQHSFERFLIADYAMSVVKVFETTGRVN